MEQTSRAWVLKFNVNGSITYKTRLYIDWITKGCDQKLAGTLPLCFFQEQSFNICCDYVEHEYCK